MRHGVLVMARRVGGSRAYRICKRVFDIAFSVCVIAVGLGPGLILSAFIARDTGGSPIYTQERVGMGGRTFRIYKFRTMVADSDDVEKYLNSDQLAQWRLERKVDDDPRITPLGRKLRSTSVDEIPNFINVLKGDIPLRILKMRQVFSKKKLDAFALPATEVRTNLAAFLQVNRGFRYCLHALQKTSTNFIAPCDNSREFFAKAECGVKCTMSNVHFTSALKSPSTALAIAIVDGRRSFDCRVAA